MYETFSSSSSSSEASTSFATRFGTGGSGYPSPSSSVTMADARSFSVLEGNGLGLGSPSKISPFGGTQLQATQMTPGSSRKGKRRTLVEEDEEEAEAIKTEDENDDMDMDEVEEGSLSRRIQQPVFSSGAPGSGRVCRALPNRRERGGEGRTPGNRTGNAGLGRTTSLPADVFSAVHGF